MIALNSFPLRKFTAVSFCRISLKVLLLRLLLRSLLFAVGCDVAMTKCQLHVIGGDIGQSSSASGV